jgi:hypothetical protein
MNIKAKLGLACLLSTATTIGIAGSASAVGIIFSPVNAVIDSGGPGYDNNPISVTYDRSGLSSGFTSGVTDFDTYIASNPTHTIFYVGNEWFSNQGTTSATVTYDLGSSKTIDKLALWNEEFSSIGTLNLFYSNDNVNFFSLASGLSPTNNPLDVDYKADVFSFASTNARYVRFEASACEQVNYAGCGIAEVAFSVNTIAAAVPEPFTIVGTLVGGTAALRMRKKLKTSQKV